MNAGDPSPAAPASARAGLLLPAVLAIVLSAALLLAQRRLDFTVNEEGFLWYGAVDTAVLALGIVVFLFALVVFGRLEGNFAEEL